MALRFPEGTLDQIQLRHEALRVAAAVAGCSRVAVWAEPRLETAVAVVGALLAGVPIVPLNPRSGERELAHVLSDSAPDAVLGGAPADLGVPPLEPAAAPAEPGAEPGPDAPALIVYTSGTTGPPKGAILPRRAVAACLDGLADAWGLSADDVVVQALPLFHVHGLVLGILGPLRAGGAAWHLGRFSPEGIAAALCDGGTAVYGVPTMYRRLNDAAEAEPEVALALGRARILVSGSAALPASEHARLEAVSGQRALERYGMTETLITISTRVGGDRRPGSVGVPIAGVELRLVDDDGAPIDAADDATIGEIELRGPTLFLGYLNRPEATEAAMHDGWFRTGDLATRASDGFIRIVGRRATDLIKSGGYKIGAGEIEAALRDHPAVEDAAVTGEPDPDLGERVAAWIVLSDGVPAPDERELADHVAALLAPHKRPRTVRFVDDLPRNALGKVQKTLLRSEP